ncbi:MAG: outer membrane protein transport protein [Bacteroidota bacterium]|nr:outer membrane protein transport protein [Bacteroidota bacterium]
MIKKSLLSLGLLLGFVAGIHAQDEFDALKASQTQLKGTARYMGMGGAFTALGGDASAISLNPAGLGVYRSSELTATLNMMNNSSNSTWKGVTNSDNNIFAHFNNLSIVATIPGTDQYSSALSFTFDRLKSFNRNGVVSGANQLSSLTKSIAYRTGGISENDILSNDAYSDPVKNIPWISILGYDGHLIVPSSSGTNQWASLLGNTENVLPSYSYSERGYIDQYSIAYGANISNIVYLGASVGWQSLNYSLISNYSEVFGTGGSMNLRNEIYTTGSGFDIKLGVIVRPTDFLRLGFAYHTPMFYNMTDNTYASLNFDTDRRGTVATPDEGGYSKYKVQTPSYYNFGLAAIIGKKGILSFDYQYEDFSTMKLKNQDGDSQPYQFENEGVKANMKSVSSFKVGGEFRATDNIALRLGYNYIAPATKTDAFRILGPGNSTRTDSEYFLDVNTQNFTAGIGFRYNNWNFDLAYVLSNQKQDFYPYDDADLAPARLTTRNSNLAFTIGLRY